MVTVVARYSPKPNQLYILFGLTSENLMQNPCMGVGCDTFAKFKTEKILKVVP